MRLANVRLLTILFASINTAYITINVLYAALCSLLLKRHCNFIDELMVFHCARCGVHYKTLASHVIEKAGTPSMSTKAGRKEPFLM